MRLGWLEMKGRMKGEVETGKVRVGLGGKGYGCADVVLWGG